MTTPKIKVSQLSLATSATLSDTFMILQDGVNKKITLTNILKYLDSGDSIRVNPLQSAINFSVATKNDANSLLVNGTTDRVGVGTSSPQSKLHCNGNLQVGSSSDDGVMLHSTNGVLYTTYNNTSNETVSLSTSRTTTSITCDNGVAARFTLPNGLNGQLKVITCASFGASLTVSCSGNGFNLITMYSVGDTITLQYLAAISKWCVVGKESFHSTNDIQFSTV